MCIYRFISPSGKSYVGQARDYSDRQYHRLSDYRHWLKVKDDVTKSEAERRGTNPRLYLAFLKYGVENFRAEILEENIENQEKLDELENYYIDFYDCIHKGYNVCLGGNLGINPETGRGYNYGKSSYFANQSDDIVGYKREYYDKNQKHLLEYTTAYRNAHQDKVKEHRANNRVKENNRRREQHRYLAKADKFVFGNGCLAHCFRRFFGGGRTRSRGFVFPHGDVNEQGCWIFSEC